MFTQPNVSFAALRSLTFGLCALVVSSLALTATAQKPYVVPRLEEPIQFDGLSNEPAWTAIEPLPLVMQTPTFRGTPTEKTEIRIAYDDAYVYVAARCYDDPDSIRGTSFKRDLLSPRPDNLALILDTFDDNENGLAFFTFPTGARTDMTVYNDAEGDFPFNLDWDTFWTVEVVRNGEGWFVEMRIPFSSLRFQDENGRVEMGLIVDRYIARKNEVVGYPAIERKYGPWSWAKPSLAQTIVFEGIQGTRPLYVSPYTIGGLGQYAELNGSETAYETASERVAFPERDRRFNVHVARLRVEASLNTELSGAAFLQYDSADDAVITNVRLRYNPRQGNDLYLVYNHGLNTDRYRRTPTLPMTDRWTILVKYTHTLNFGI